MGRPERPVTGADPLGNLARALRLVRRQAGSPVYRELSARTLYSREVLSAAARGEECPSWEVTKAFADACDPTGTAAQRLHPVWEKARLWERSRRPPTSRDRRERSGPTSTRRDRPQVIATAPRPDPEGAPARYVYQLRALRAWAGNPGHKEIGRRAGRPLASSTMYDALSRTRTTLPPLETVQAIVHACLADDNAAAGWIAAWRAIALREFEHVNRLDADAARPDLRIVTGG